MVVLELDGAEEMHRFEDQRRAGTVLGSHGRSDFPQPTLLFQDTEI